MSTLHCPKDKTCTHTVYSHCMFCNGAIFGPACWAFSHGVIPCKNCGKQIKYLDAHKETQ